MISELFLAIQTNFTALFMKAEILFGFSYREDSDDTTDSDDVIEVEYTETEQQKNNAETIERVLKHRIGKKGGK